VTINRFRLSRRAETDIAEIRDYIALDTATAADKFVGELFDLFQLLGWNPEIGQQRHDLRPNLRSISHGSYAVFYYPASNGAEIAAVVHGARDIDTLFREGGR
jgi:toxin ParE1/3/4